MSSCCALDSTQLLAVVPALLLHALIQANSLTSVGWYDPIKTINQICLSLQCIKSAFCLTQMNICSRCFDLTQKLKWFVLADGMRQTNVNWLTTYSTGCHWCQNSEDQQRFNYMNSSMTLVSRLFMHNAMLGHTHYENLEVYIATYSSIYFSYHQTTQLEAAPSK